jgi:tRNA threonylcarbamoyladenosine biosynthesis protein TsaB
LKILSLETSTELCSAALWCDGRIESREAQAGQKHSELLLPMVDVLLVSQNLKLRDIDGIAFGAGPGSFTGLRIACGIAQGLAFGADIPVLGVSTLLALAEASRAERAVCCFDARMGKIYHAAYEKLGSDWHTVYEPGLYAPQGAPPLPGNQWVACGSGFAAYRAALEQRYQGQLVQIPDTLMPHAREVAVLAARGFERGQGIPADQAAPLYVRDKVALRVDERPPR